MRAIPIIMNDCLFTDYSPTNLLLLILFYLDISFILVIMEDRVGLEHTVWNKRLKVSAVRRYGNRSLYSKLFVSLFSAINTAPLRKWNLQAICVLGLIVT